MSDKQCSLRMEHRIRYPHLTPNIWYDVCPVFPGVTQRRVDVFGERLTRIRTKFGFETVKAAHFEFRTRVDAPPPQEPIPERTETRQAS